MIRQSGLVPVAMACALAVVSAGEPASYGEALVLEQALPIGDLLADPDSWVGKRVRVEGEITDVCPRAGCWIDIGGGRSGTIRFKVDDGVIVFPVEAEGRGVVAEGTLVRLELTEEQAVARARHLAEEKGEAFDPSTVEPPYVYYQIRGKGAEIR
jgi:hypothetical protein